MDLDQTAARLARAVVLLMLVVIAASAALRLLQHGLPCDAWPACRTASDLVAAPLPAPTADPVPLLRVVHRIAATAVLLINLALLALLWRKDAARVARRWALVLLTLALLLSAIGVATPGSRDGAAAAAVLLANLLGGLLMLAVAVRLWLALRPLPPAAGARLAPIALALWLAQAALGALSGAALLPAAPHLHLALAALALPAAVALGFVAWRGGARRRAGMLLAAAAAQYALGAAAAGQAAPLALVLVHNAGAALGIALLAALCGAARGGRGTAAGG